MRSGRARRASEAVRADLRSPSVRVEWMRRRGVPVGMTDHPHDQDADPPTPDGEEPDIDQLRPGSEPASDPDPDPDEGTTNTSEEDA